MFALVMRTPKGWMPGRQVSGAGATVWLTTGAAVTSAALQIQWAAGHSRNQRPDPVPARKARLGWPRPRFRKRDNERRVAGWSVRQDGSLHACVDTGAVDPLQKLTGSGKL